MSLVGRTLAHYEILATLGEGGMGVVYKARDTRLGRFVAIKILRPDALADPERKRRFAQEARSASALNHPGIVTIYDISQQDGVDFIAMEYVQGKTLDQLIGRKGLSLGQTVAYAIQAADALAKAHAAGIIHRDLKPSNIMVTDDGLVKILDFGLAKLTAQSGADHTGSGPSSATVAGSLQTAPGHIVGTPVYMSPEQAEGNTVDSRSDIFSFGSVLYKMATGTRPFHGQSAVASLAAVLTSDPLPPSQVVPGLPREFERIILRCLRKDPGRRFQVMADLVLELDEVSTESGAQIKRGPAQARVPSPLWRRIGGSAAGPAVTAAVTVAMLIGVYFLGRRAGQAPGAEPEIGPVEFTQLTTQPGLEQFPSVSPDGRWIAYTSEAAGNEDIYLQSVGGRTPINLTAGSPAADWSPAFSPDGERIAFRSDREGGGIFVMGRTGESQTRVSDAGWNPAWSPDGSEIVYSTQGVDHPFTRGTLAELWSVKVATGAKRRVTASDAVQPNWSPHGYRIAYWATPADGGQRDIWTVPAAGGDPVLVTSDGAYDWCPVWSQDGRFIYFSSDRGGSMNLWRVAVDEETGAVRGSPQPVTAPSSFVGQISLSADGHRLVYANLSLQNNIAVVGFDPVAGKVVGQPRSVTRGTRLWWGPDPSPDGAWVAFNSFMPEDIFIIHPDGTDLTQLTNDSFNDRNPHWSGDSKLVTFYSDRSGKYNIWSVSPDGSGLQQLTFADRALLGGTWSPDGSKMIGSDNRTPGRVRGLIFDPKRPWKDQKPQVVSAPPQGNFNGAVWSPDGRRISSANWVYSLDSGTFDSLPAPAAPSRNSRGILAPGSIPSAWLNDSRRIIVNVAGKLFLVDSGTKQVGELLFLPGESVHYPSLSRDNRWLYFSRGSVEGDVWMMALK